jgi:hypothetical protein
VAHIVPAGLHVQWPQAPHCGDSQHSNAWERVVRMDGHQRAKASFVIIIITIIITLLYWGGCVGLVANLDAAVDRSNVKLRKGMFSFDTNYTWLSTTLYTTY